VCCKRDEARAQPRLGFSVALIELFLGVVVGNAFSLTVPDSLIVR
jgi:hypothetical protein